MSDITPEPTADERLAQIRDRNRRLLAVPFETHGGDVHGPGCPACELVRAIGDMQWLLEQLGEVRKPAELQQQITDQLWRRSHEIRRQAEETEGTRGHELRGESAGLWMAGRMVREWKPAEQQPEDGDRG